MQRLVRSDLSVLLQLCSATSSAILVRRAPSIQHRGAISVNSRRGFFRGTVKLDPRRIQEIDEEFQKVPLGERTKANFLIYTELFKSTSGRRRLGHVEFITTALRYLKDYELHKDPDVYKALLNVFPKGLLIPTNRFQKMLLHQPIHQVCCVTVLDQMEWFGVHPDKELHEIVVSAFGEWNYATKKVKRMLYWMPKLRHTNKYLDVREVENQSLKDVELARLALKTMCRDAGTAFTLVKTPSTELDFGKWIVSAQSPLQQRLLRQQPANTCFRVDGPSRVYVTDKQVNYVVLSTASTVAADEEFVDQRTNHDSTTNLHDRLFDVGKENEPNVHQQSDQTILAMAVLESTTQSMASAWINHLQRRNAALENADVLFRIKDRVIEERRSEATGEEEVTA